MAASINASTSAGVVTTADTTGNLNLQSNGTTIIGYTSTGVTVTGTLSAGDTTITGALIATGSSAYGPRANASSTGRVSVSTGATTLSTLSSGGSVGATVALFIVNGYNTGGSGNSFMDLVMFVAGASPNTLASIGKGSPAARTYSASGSSFQLAMASGTYNVSVTQFEQSC